MRIHNISTEHKRDVFRLIRDIGLAVLGILGPVATVWAIWIHLEVWALVMALGLALMVSVLFYYRRRIRAVPYLKEGKEAQIEAVKLLRATKERLHYYGGVGFISDSDEWRAEYTKKLQSETGIFRFLDTKSLEEMEKLLTKAMSPEEVNTAKAAYGKWLTTHCENLKARVQHNYFYDFKGAPIWRYGLHCIIFDEKHVVMPFASGKTSKAIFIRNCPEIARALAHCLEWLTTDFSLETKSCEELATLVGLSPNICKKRTNCS